MQKEKTPEKVILLNNILIEEQDGSHNILVKKGTVGEWRSSLKEFRIYNNGRILRISLESAIGRTDLYEIIHKNG